MAPSASTLDIFSIDKDAVVDAVMATGRTNYAFALEQLTPLIDRLEIQRRIQNPSFYGRLKRDILRGCLMPPITLAFINPSKAILKTTASFESYVKSNVTDGFILDGIQRLSTLTRAYEEHPDELPMKQSLFVNILVCKSMDNLLYRMITLNNGQKPMTTRHQIEILTSNLFNFESDGVELKTEKDGVKRKSGIFKQADFVLGYMAFLSSSTNVDSQKLIAEKLDDLLASKILQHDPTDDTVQFSTVIDLLGSLTSRPMLDRWFRVNNNLIGFCAGIREGYDVIRKMPPAKFEEILTCFEEAFRSFDVSKIKLGRARRSAAHYLIRNISKLKAASVAELTDKLINAIE
jgi:hypothetical protein